MQSSQVNEDLVGWPRWDSNPYLPLAKLALYPIELRGLFRDIARERTLTVEAGMNPKIALQQYYNIFVVVLVVI